MEPGQTTEAVFVAIASVMTTAVSRGEWAKARVCMEMLTAIEAARVAQGEARSRRKAEETRPVY